MGKEKERDGLRNKLSYFLKKIAHFLHFKTFSSIIVFMQYNAFLSNSNAVSFATEVISISISNPTLIHLFILLPVTLKLAYNPDNQRNLFKGHETSRLT